MERADFLSDLWQTSCTIQYLEELDGVVHQASSRATFFKLGRISIYQDTDAWNVGGKIVAQPHLPSRVCPRAEATTPEAGNSNYTDFHLKTEFIHGTGGITYSTTVSSGLGLWTGVKP
jgi:hypothetical protein